MDSVCKMSGSPIAKRSLACPFVLRQIYAYLIHFMISGRFGFFPYIRIPTR